MTDSVRVSGNWIFGDDFEVSYTILREQASSVMKQKVNEPQGEAKPYGLTGGPSRLPKYNALPCRQKRVGGFCR